MAETIIHAVTEEVHASHAHHPELSFFRKYIWSEDHKTIALQYLFTSLFFLLVGGSLAMGVRFQLAFPGAPVPLIGTLLPSWLVTSAGAFQPGGYNGLVTMHATVMVFSRDYAGVDRCVRKPLDPARDRSAGHGFSVL